MQDAAYIIFYVGECGLRQPIKSFFGWLNEKNQTQNSIKGKK